MARAVGRPRKAAKIAPVLSVQRQLLGLKHFTGRVSDTLQEISPATHAELINTIVDTVNAEIRAYHAEHGEDVVGPLPPPIARDDPNMLRRAYDALNILSALRFMARGDDKRYYWLGPLFRSTDGIPYDASPASLPYPAPGHIVAEAPETLVAVEAARSDDDGSEFGDVPVESAPAPGPNPSFAAAVPPGSDPVVVLAELEAEVNALRQSATGEAALLDALRTLDRDNSARPAAPPRLEPPFMVLAVPSSSNVDIHRESPQGLSWRLTVESGVKLLSDRQIILQRGNN